MAFGVLLADVIKAIHLLLVMFIVCVPLYQPINWTVLVLHVTSAMTLLVHWQFNEDACFLTLVETWLRGVPESKSFMHSIVSPVYKIDDEHLKTVATWATVLLGSVSLWRLYKSWDIVKSGLTDIYNQRLVTIANI